MSSLPNAALPTAADVDAAAQRLAGIALRTPLVTSPVLDGITGGRIFLKAEILQRTGSFKFRGAYNKLSSIPPSERGTGVVAFSWTNKGKACAFDFEPNTDAGCSVSGEVTVDPLDIGSTEDYGAVMTADFEWSIVGEPAVAFPAPGP